MIVQALDLQMLLSGIVVPGSETAHMGCMHTSAGGGSQLCGAPCRILDDYFFFWLQFNARLYFQSRKHVA